MAYCRQVNETARLQVIGSLPIYGQNWSQRAEKLAGLIACTTPQVRTWNSKTVHAKCSYRVHHIP